jgi:hypothetical protein
MTTSYTTRTIPATSYNARTDVSFILREDWFFLLREDWGRFIREESYDINTQYTTRIIP